MRFVKFQCWFVFIWPACLDFSHELYRVKCLSKELNFFYSVDSKNCTIFRYKSLESYSQHPTRFVHVSASFGYLQGGIRQKSRNMANYVTDVQLYFTLLYFFYLILCSSCNKYRRIILLHGTSIVFKNSMYFNFTNLAQNNVTRDNLNWKLLKNQKNLSSN